MNKSYIAATVFTVAAFFSMACAAGELKYCDYKPIALRTAHCGCREYKDTVLNVWRGEELFLTADFISDKPTGRVRVSILPDRFGNAPEFCSAKWASYVLSNSYRSCGWPADTLPVFEVADALLSDCTGPMASGAVRRLVVSARIPYDLPPGTVCRSGVVVRDESGEVVSDTLDFSFRVLDRTMPKPSETGFYVDFWQQPYAVSRYHGVEPWSREHLALLEPYARQLARAGQRTITAILFDEPWGVQSNDRFEAMVRSSIDENGNWEYDYSALDAYVRLMLDNGVGPLIECFSMIPWDMTFTYFDKRENRDLSVKCETSSPEYRAIWTPFLINLKKHMSENGWLENTVLAIDERNKTDMENVIALVKDVAPEFKIALAGNYHSELDPELYAYTITLGDEFPEGALENRRKQGRVSAFYTCCSSPEPNIFSNSDPVDAVYLPLCCAAKGADGYLHWAFNNFTDSPNTDTRFFMFAPGDTYCIYPGALSSVRWEWFLKGVQMVAKIQILQNELVGERRDRLNDLFRRCSEHPSTFENRCKAVADLELFLAEIE